jgi:serine/threonine protein kinase
MQEQSIFIEALEREDPAERAAFLDRTCAADPALRARIERLLRRHQQAGGFLEQPAGLPGGTVDESSSPSAPGDQRVAGLTTGEDPGTVLAGRYKLLEAIGEGGMGTVWMARQTEPVQRLVAVKLIKAGLDSRQVLARFEAERQALALMDHPNIAKVLDAGAAPDGRPFFVMELVRGVPITRHCDEHRLTPRQRLELFVPVCQAIQHAHTKGIIHRDVKPSNVLVASYDGQPVPKVIDFGIAKATGQQLTEHTLVTGFGAVVGTLEYMSPEQAELNPLDIDTRSDVYCLGVLLYELLTGATPLERKRLKETPLLEALRQIREQEPAKPSTKLSTAEGLPALAANRGTEPAKLAKLVRGELDWIVMKCLEKDRNRRYETANSLAMDVQRYLTDEPVQACPPSRRYRLRKWLRKHRAAAATGLGLALMLLVLSLGLAANNLMIRNEQKRTQAANARLQDNLNLSLQTLDEIYLKALEIRLPRDTEAAQENQELLTKALGFYESFAERNEADPNVWREVAKAYKRAGALHMHLGHYDQAIVSVGRATDVVARLMAGSPGDDELKLLLAEMHLLKGDTYWQQRELVNEGSHQAKAARVEYQKGIDLLEPLTENSALAPKYREMLANLHSDLGLCFQRDGDLEKGEEHCRQAIKLYARLVEEEKELGSKLLSMLLLSHSRSKLGRVLCQANHLDGAEKELRQAIAGLERVNTQGSALPGYKRGRLPNLKGTDLISVQSLLAHAHYGLGNSLRFKGQSGAALEEFHQAVDFQAQAVKDWPGEIQFRMWLAYFRNGSGLLLFEGGRRPEAIDQCRQAIELYRQLQKESRRELANAEKFIESLTLMGDSLYAEGDRKGASSYYREALDLTQKLAAQNASFENDLAWFLVACADADFRNPARALGIAQKVVDRSAGQDADPWNTLGVAQYRLDKWEDAVASLEKAKKLHKENDAGDWLFLAMAQWRLGQKQQARESYQRAGELLKKYEYPPAEASRWRAEAAAVLGLDESKK